VSGILGVELTANALRAVRIAGWKSRLSDAAEAEWDPANPGPGVATLLEKLGGARATRVVVAIDLSLLFVKRLKLPPVSAAEKKRIVSLEPDRFFPVRGDEELAVVMRDADALAFAATEERLAGWLTAMEALGPLDYVEPAPASLARALASKGTSEATVLLDRGESGVVIVEVAGGTARDARRVPGTLLQAATFFAEADPEASRPRPLYLHPFSEAQAEEITRVLSSVDLRALPSLDTGAPASLVAFGAALGAGSTLDGAFAPAAAMKKLQTRRRQPRFAAAAAFLAALAFATWSADFSRARTERRLSAELLALSDRSSSALALETETRRLAREEQVLARALRERPHQLATLMAVSVGLPADAQIQMLRASGLEWQIDGVAANAARIVPALEAHGSLEGVRFLEATRRAERDGRIRENFSLALRAVRAP